NYKMRAVIECSRSINKNIFMTISIDYTVFSVEYNSSSVIDGDGLCVRNFVFTNVNSSPCMDDGISLWAVSIYNGLAKSYINCFTTVVGCSYNGRCRNFLATVIRSVCRKSTQYRSNRVNQCNELFVCSNVSAFFSSNPGSLDYPCTTSGECYFFNNYIHYYICTVIDNSNVICIGDACTVNSNVGWRMHKYRR